MIQRVLAGYNVPVRARRRVWNMLNDRLHLLLVCILLSAIAILSCGDGEDNAGPTGPDVVTEPDVVEEPDAVVNTPEVPAGAGALRFDGSNDRVTVPYDPSFPTEIFTIGAWIKLTPPRSRAFGHRAGRG